MHAGNFDSYHIAALHVASLAVYSYSYFTTLAILNAMMTVKCVAFITS